jgi:RNA polymerase sigma-70 factor (ECF subfamily)
VADSDDPLLFGLSVGDQRAFEALYDRDAGRLYRAALAMLGRPEDAEDAVQEVFMAMVRGRGKLAGVRDLRAYLFAALRHAAARRLARRAREPVGGDAAAREAAAPAGRSEGDPLAERLHREIGALPPPQREVVILKIEGQLTFAQIAEVLDISANTAASRYRYALEKLRIKLSTPE